MSDLHKTTGLDRSNMLLWAAIAVIGIGVLYLAFNISKGDTGKPYQSEYSIAVDAYKKQLEEYKKQMEEMQKTYSDMSASYLRQEEQNRAALKLTEDANAETKRANDSLIRLSEEANSEAKRFNAALEKLMEEMNERLQRLEERPQR